MTVSRNTVSLAVGNRGTADTPDYVMAELIFPETFPPDGAAIQLRTRDPLSGAEKLAWSGTRKGNSFTLEIFAGAPSIVCTKIS